jgi:hypothetical protein
MPTLYPSLQDTLPHAVNHSLGFLKMGKWLPETCWTDLEINKLLFLHLVGHLYYLATSMMTGQTQIKWFLVNDQRDAQIPFHIYFLFIILYMFRAHRAHHQERQIVSIQPLVTVTLCWWPCYVQVGNELRSIPTCTRHKYRERNLCFTLVIYQESLNDARSTKCKNLLGYSDIFF